MRTMTFNVCVAAIALAPLALAQNTPKDRPVAAPMTEKPAHLIKLSQVVDVDLRDAKDNACGEIDGLVIDPTTGAIVYALIGEGGVLGIGEKEHMLPWESFHLVPKDKDKADKFVARTKLTKEQIERAPVYKKNERIDAETERLARTAAGVTGDAITRDSAAPLISSREIDDATVRGPDEKDLGKIDEVVLAPQEGALAYVVLESGGVLGMGDKDCALPWALVRTSWNADKKLVLSTAVTKEKLESAPHFEDKDWKRMSSPAWVEELCRHHGCDPYTKRTVKASATKPMNN
jgi:hypothetical protein